MLIGELEVGEEYAWRGTQAVGRVRLIKFESRTSSYNRRAHRVPIIEHLDIETGVTLLNDEGKPRRNTTDKDKILRQWDEYVQVRESQAVDRTNALTSIQTWNGKLDDICEYFDLTLMDVFSPAKLNYNETSCQVPQIRDDKVLIEALHYFIQQNPRS